MANSFASKTFTALSELHPNMANLVGFSYAVVGWLSNETMWSCYAVSMLSVHLTHDCMIDKCRDTHCISILLDIKYL